MVSDSRERFETWYRQWDPECIFETHGEGNPYGYPTGHYTVCSIQYEWEAWQAAEAQAVRRCAQVADNLPPSSTSRQARNAIRAEFPEAWK